MNRGATLVVIFRDAGKPSALDAITFDEIYIGGQLVGARSGSAGRGLLYSVTTGTASIAAGIALLPLVISTVGPAPYGVWLFLIAISSYFNYSDLGVGTAIVHFGSRARGGATRFQMSELLSAGLVWTSVVGVIVVPIYIYISWIYLEGVQADAGVSSRDAEILLVLASAVACGLLIRPFSGALVGAGHLLLDRKFQFAGVIARVLGTLVACLAFKSVAAVAVAETVALLLPTVLATVTVLAKKIAKVRFTPALLPTLKYMMRFSTKAFAVSMSSALIANGGTLIIGIVGSPAQVTYFAAATRVLTGVGQITSWASAPFQSTLSRLYFSSPDQAKSMVRNLVFSSFSVSAICCGVIIWGSYPIIDFWLGTEVDTSVVSTTMVLLLCGAVINSLQRPMLIAAEAAGRPGLFFKVQFSVALIFWALAFVLGPHFGAVGVALARLIPIFAASPIYLLISRKTFGLSLSMWWRDSFSPATIFLLPASILALGVALLPLQSEVFDTQWLSAAVYAFSCLAFALIFRSRLPISALRASLRAVM
ncbi:lipopolysaccharide biosynthesis protein [Pseudarthrobacter enclensis]|uniref:lipopolysaccharide biosynthesis protein n=1 Tax=Pseudarthrobacter enclensis TaxID=993070 RepID=UPI003EE11C9D